MKTVSINKKSLVDALGQATHAGFADKGWSWQVVFDPGDSEAEGRVVLVNPDTNSEVNYRLVNEEGYNVLQFANLNGFSWDAGDGVVDRDFDYITDLDQIRLSKDTRDYIEGRLVQHINLDGQTFHVEYF